MLDKQNDLAESLRRCANREREGLRAIFESEAPRLVSVAERILRRRDLAEEVVQEAFIQIWAKAHQYEPERGSAQGWVYAIVRNRALNVLRDTGRMELTADGDITSLRDTEDAELAISAWSRLASNSRLRRCLDGLDDLKRRTILMAYVSGYSHGEIAGRLKVPLGTAKAWIRRGLAALRECMA
jgi:RNA polymerase sigma-70 factor (ECF subfamily)